MISTSMIKRILCIIVFATLSAPVIQQLRAADGVTDADALAKESEDYCTSTAQTRPTPPDVIVAKVNEACALLEKEGRAAFPKFSGKGSPFIYEGTYVSVHSLADCTTLVHPLKPKMVGNQLTSLKDAKGKRFYITEDDLVRTKGEGWVEYYWPKPGSQEIARKITFVKKCKLPDGTEVVVCSGMSNFSDADAAKLELH